MSGRWSRSYAELAPPAVQVLRAAVLLDGSELVVADVAIALGLPMPHVAAAFEELRQAGWVRTGSDETDVFTGGARRWLNEALADAEPDELPALATRLAEFQTAGLDARQDQDERVRWATEHRGTIVTTVRAVARAGQFDTAAKLATTAWQVAARVPDPSWWHDLARCGEEAAIRGRDPVGLIALLNRSAEVFADAGNRVDAEQQWIRSLDVCHTLEDHNHTVTALTALCELYRDWGLLDKALDVLLELVNEHESAGEPGSVAGALADVGSIMLSSGRPSAAETYLSRAAQLVDAAPGVVAPPARAAILELRGRALWLTGQPGRARRCFDDALALLVDVDDVAAARVRRLRATDPDAALPAD